MKFRHINHHMPFGSHTKKLSMYKTGFIRFCKGNESLLCRASSSRITIVPLNKYWPLVNKLAEHRITSNLLINSLLPWGHINANSVLSITRSDNLVAGLENYRSFMKKLISLSVTLLKFTQWPECCLTVNTKNIFTELSLCPVKHNSSLFLCRSNPLIQPLCCKNVWPWDLIHQLWSLGFPISTDGHYFIGEIA